MAKFIENYFKLAAECAISENDINKTRHFRLGCVGIRSDGAIVKSNNSSSISPNRTIHAEYKLCRKMDKGGEIFVCRVKYNGGFYGMARPCIACQKLIISKNISKVYYTINDMQYGIYFPKLDLDKVYNL